MSSSAIKVGSSGKTYTYQSSGGNLHDGGNVSSIEYHADMTNISRLEDKIRLLQEDIEYERELRQKVEREKSTLSVTVIQLQERVEEVEAGADGQYEINRKRDSELAKLRKLLEDVHLESEQSLHIMKKKHSETVVEFQDQVDILSKSRGKFEKEKIKIQQECFELTEQLEKSTVECASYHKSIKSLNITVEEYYKRIEELNKTIVDITSSKQRLSVENVEMSKTVQEMRIKIEEISYSSKSASGSYDDLKRKYDSEYRKCSKLEAEINSLSNELIMLKKAYDEEAELRLAIERKLSMESQLVLQFKSKFESESRLRIEEVEEIKKKLSIKIVELEEYVSALTAKVSGVEKQKMRLSQEIEIVIIDLEKANGAHREIKSKYEIIERDYKSISLKYEEISILHEQVTRELKARQIDITSISKEYTDIKVSHERLSLDYKKVSGELGDMKSGYGDMGRMKHDLELQIQSLERERADLAHALGDADSAFKVEESRYLKLSNEVQSYKIEMEKKLYISVEEIEIVRKNMSVDIEMLNSRVVEAETRLKSEVSKIKKKFQLTITELEMSLDTANKTNIDLQKTCKKQSITLQELQVHYDELQRGLQQTLDQYGMAQRRIQALTAEYEEARSSLEIAIRSRRTIEVQYEDAGARIKDLTVINTNLAGMKMKLEQEISIIASDYENVSKELRIVEERYSKASIEIKRVSELLHEESERYIKIESIKNSLSIEVKNLSIRIEESEANNMASIQRMVSKLESRVHELEMHLEEERRLHSQTVSILKKKERNIKELVMQCEEDHKNISILQETLEKSYEKVTIYKRQLHEQESMSSTNLSRVRRFQRELETAEERAETAESNLTMIRAKHRTFVTNQVTTLPTGEHVIIKETYTQEGY